MQGTPATKFRAGSTPVAFPNSLPPLNGAALVSGAGNTTGWTARPPLIQPASLPAAGVLPVWDGAGGFVAGGAASHAGSLTLGGALTANGVVKATGSGLGSVQLSPGGNPQVGLVEWLQPNGARTAYLGYNGDANLTLGFDQGGALTIGGAVHGPNTGDTGPWLRGALATSGIGVQDDRTTIWRDGTRIFSAGGEGICAYNVSPIGLSRTQTPQVYLYCEGDSMIGLTNPDGVTYGTLNAAVVSHPSAALTVGNSSHGVTVPGDLNCSQTVKGSAFWVDGNEVLNTNGSGVNTVIGIAGGARQISFGNNVSSGYGDLRVYLGGRVDTAGPRIRVPQETNAIHFESGDGTVGATFSAGAATFSGDISMQKATQGYIRAYSPNGSNNGSFYCDNTGDTYLYSNTNWLGLGSQTGVNYFYKAGIQQEVRFYSQDATKFSGISTTNAGLTSLSLSTSGNIATTSNAAGRIDFSSSYMAINPGSGWMYAYRAGVNSRFETYDSTGTKYTRLTHDGTNGILSTSIGGILLETPTGTVSLYKASTQSSLVVYGNPAYTTTLTHNGTAGVLSTNYGNLSLVPTGGTVAVTGGITASGVVTLPNNLGSGSLVFSGSTSRLRSSGNYVYLESPQNVAIGSSVISDTLTCDTANNTTPFARIIGYANNGKAQLALYTKSGQTVSPFLLGDSTLTTLVGFAATTGAFEINNGTVVSSGGSYVDLTCAGITASGVSRQSAELTATPSGTTQTMPLTDANHQTLSLASSSGDVTVTLTVPATSAWGTLILKQHGTTPRDVTWAVSAGTIKWLGTEPTWNADAVDAVRVVTWRYDGSVMYLEASAAG